MAAAGVVGIEMVHQTEGGERAIQAEEVGLVRKSGVVAEELVQKLGEVVAVWILLLMACVIQLAVAAAFCQSVGEVLSEMQTRLVAELS